MNISKHIINHIQTVTEALNMINQLDCDITLFVVDENNKLIGTFTDGDFRRGIIKGLTINDSLRNFANKNFIFFLDGQVDVHRVILAREQNLKIVPILNESGYIVNFINFSYYKSYLPVDAVIMAGGEGIRLRPLTENMPKPMLKIGDKPILEHIVDRLCRFGINNIHISINYLGDKIKEHFNTGVEKNIKIKYIHEKTKMGTIGSLSQANEFQNLYLLIMNSDILTNINFEMFFLDFLKKDADISIACIPYNVSIPYAIMYINGDDVKGLKEKPTLNYVSNAGIYLIKKEHLKRIPFEKNYNATDLIEEMIKSKLKVTYYTILDYWLDIGKMDDYIKAQNDIRHIKI
jgi:dTDP-glucose pyrophosphorylase